MGAAYYICVDRDDLEAETAVDGKALARAVDDLQEICDELGLDPIDEFLGMSADDIEELLGEEIELPEDQREATWFDAQEGIAYFSKLVEHLRSNPEAVEDSGAVIQDLEDIVGVLNQANAVGARWHLAIDV